MHPPTRRAFLHASGLAMLGLAVACGKERGLIASAATLDTVIDGRSPGLKATVAPFETFPRKSQRVVFGLQDAQGLPLQDTRANLWAATDRDAKPIGPALASYRSEGLGERGVYVAEMTFPNEGNFILVVEALGGSVTEPKIGVGQLQVGPQTNMPRPGDRAIVVATPTVDQARGVDPICTRTPPCGMHRISLDRALENGKPTVIIIGSPAFCTSRLCGPEVDILQDVSAELGDRVDFVHIELLKDDESETVSRQFPLSPAAKAWRTEQEPVIYFIDAAGTIVERIIGPFDRAEARATAGALVEA